MIQNETDKEKNNTTSKLDEKVPNLENSGQKSARDVFYYENKSDEEKEEDVQKFEILS